MSAIEIWQESAAVSDPMLHTCRSCTSFTPSIAANDGFHPFQLDALRRAFEQDVQGLTHDAESRPQNQRADPKRKRRVNPVLAGRQNRPAANDDGRGRNRVADLVQEGAANVDVALGRCKASAR